MAQVNDLHTQVGSLESDAASQRVYEGEQDEEHKDRDTEPSSPTVGDDEKPSEVDSGSYHEVERNIGVTKIEALYIVFGKGWKLAMLWLYVLFVFWTHIMMLMTDPFCWFTMSSVLVIILFGTVCPSSDI